MNNLLEPESVYLIIGAEGKLTESALSKFKENPSSIYIFVDYVQYLDLSKAVPNNVKLAIFSEDLTQDLIQLSALMLDKKDLIVLPDKSGASRFNTIMAQLEIAIEQMKFWMSGNANFECFADMALKNVFDLHTPLIEYSDWCEGKTAIVLGAAPSIDMHLAWLKQHQDKLVIFAVARLAKRLDKEGIKPDFFIATDPTLATVAHAKSLEKFQQDTVLVLQHYANHDLVDRWMGQTLYWGPEFPYQSKDFVTPQNVEITGGTVANYGVLTALGMGCKRVYITGMDLCFSDIKRTHESSSIEASSEQSFYAPETIETYRNQKVATTIEFKLAAEILPQQIESLVHDYGLDDDFELFNLYENAAKIKYIDHLSLDDVVLPEASKVDTKLLIDKLNVPEQQARQRQQKKFVELNKSMKLYREALQQLAPIKKHLSKFSEASMALPGVMEEWLAKWKS